MTSCGTRTKASPPSPAKTISVGIGGIAIKPERLRALRPERITELAASMLAVGLLQPIVLRTGRGNGYWLVAGWHRYEAARLLKWDSIRAVVFEDMKADAAELAEIDENLIHIDLSPAERAMHVARRKELYEKLFPAAKIGGAPGKAGGGKKAKDAKLASFVDQTAKQTGKGKRTVARDAKRGKDIGRDVLPDVVGTSLDTGEQLDALSNLSPQDQRDLVDQAKSGKKVSAKTAVKKRKREQRELQLGQKQQALPDRRYGVIAADPEWRFEPWSRETGMDRSADNHYPTSVTAVIAARNVPSIAAKDCALFLWATVPMLPQALLVMGAWGFDYRSHCVWIKERPGEGRGTGYWFINEHELLLVGVKGDVPAPAPGDQEISIFYAPVQEHSRKPDLAYAMIERYFPNLPRIELNRRGPPRPGWDAWGNEAVETQEAAE